MTLQDNASVTGELIVTGSGSASRVVMKGNSAINGKLTCRDDSVSFEMRDNATIDTIDVGISTVYGTVTCTGEIMSGVFERNGTVINNGKITSGIFYGTVSGNGTIEDSATVDVVFDTDGGSAVSTQKVLRGQKAVTPGYCKKDGYTLDGWYNGDIAYNFTEPVTEGFTLTAQWTANTYTVSFDSDGGTAVGDKTLGWNDKVLDGIETPTRSNGYAFNGWKYGNISVDADTTYADLAADDTIASITLTAQWLDIEKPTGEITLGENNWNSFLNGITFGLFFKETKTVTITAADNSGKTVKIEYLLSDKEMSLSELANSTFTVYTDTFSIASDNNYVIYVRLTDEAGNEEYISSDGFVIDKTAPVIEGYEDGQTVNICGSKLLTFIETNLDSVTVNGNPISLSMGKYATLSHSGSAQVVVATDKAGNTTTVTFNIASDHDFNFETQKCNHCGQNALVELTVDGVTKLYDSYASAMLVLPKEFETAEFKLLGDITEDISFSFSNGKLIFDLNGFTFKSEGKCYVGYDADMTVTGSGTMDIQFYVNNGGTLTVDNANGRIKGLTQHSGTLKVLSGTVDTLTVVPAPGDTAVRRAELYGGHYGNIQVSFYGLTCADLLEHSHRFEGISYADAKKTEMSNVNVILCNHENIDENNICMGCDIHYEAAIERNGVTTRYETLTEALDVSEDGDTLKLLADIDEDITVTGGTFTLDATGRTISGDLNVESGAKLTVNGGTINKNTVCAKGGKLTAMGGTSFKGTIDCIGEGSFTFCGFEGAFTGAGSIIVYYSVFKSTIKVSNEFYAISSSSENEITIDVDKNGKLGLIKGFYAGNIKSEGELNISDTNHSGIITAESGSKLEISRGKLNSVEINENVDVTLSGGSFGTIKVSGKQLIDCLAEDVGEGNCYAFVDKDGNVVDGRVNSLTDVTIIHNHVHDCIWDTMTHEKRCACGYVGEIDTESPVISGIEDSKAYYGAIDFTVTDDNDFTVSIDGSTAQSQLGVWTIKPDNKKHTIRATDVAGNTVNIIVTVLKIYDVTLSSGEGYTVTGADTAGHGTEYEFTVSIADGYSRTKSYRVLVNGTEISRSAGDESNDIFRIYSVDSDMIITVEGVADITAPDVEIEIGADNFKAFMNTVTFGLFFKDTQIVTVTAKDGGSGLKTVEYLLSESVFNDEGSVTGDFITLTLENGKAQFSLEPTQKAFVYVRATDVSGNIQVINSEGVVIYTDSEAVTEAVDFTMRDSNDVSFDVKLNGNTVSALYNGDTLIDSGNYTVSEDGIITLKNAYLNTLAAGEYTIRVAYDPLGEIYKNGDEPAMTSVKLTVGKRTALIDHNMSDKKYYDGKSIPEPSYRANSDGAVVIEYKFAGAADLTYITAAPKNVGVYTIRITIPETDVYNAVSSTMTYEILAKEVTISGATVEATKVYDGTTDAKITSEGTLSGVLDGDSVTIAIGKANYSDKNVGVGKTVTFTNFALSGNDAMNYTPAVQPESTTAGISAKELTITDLRVKDKQYDGKNTAEIDGTPTLVGVADGDVLELVNGIPTFDIVSIGKNIPISFTTFRLSGDDVTVGNYTLTQPTGITANITEYTADGSEYRVNSNDWINTDFVITANEGWKLSLSKDIDGEWADTLTASDETDNGSLTFYVKNTATGAISEAVTELYKIDRTAPTGEVRLNKRTAFGEFISTVTFGMLFGNDVDVELTAADNASGVKSVMYFKSDKALSETEIRTVTDWTDKSDFSIEAKDADRVIVYVRIEDNAGNIAYISSDGMTFDTTAPAVTGVENGKTYYVTKKVTVDDGNLESVTLNGDPVEGEFTLAGDTDMTYVIRAVDKVGNMTEYTVHMKPISSVTDAIRDITADNVKSDDAGTISSVERQILEIDSSEATDDEQKKLNDAAEKCEALKDRIAEVTDEGNRLDDGVNGYDIGKVTSDDIADIEKLIDDIDKLLNSDNLTDTQRDDLEDLRDKAKDMLDRITAAEDVADAEEIKAVDGITEDNVKLDDKDALEKAKKVLESAIRDFDGNYTAEERKGLDAKLETVKAALASIDNVEKAIELISRLPSLDNATHGDKSEVDRVKNMIAGLSENEKAMLGKAATEKVDALEKKIRKLAENPVSPDTGYESDPISWAALLFISGGVVTGTAIINKKKKRSVR